MSPQRLENKSKIQQMAASVHAITASKAFFDTIVEAAGNPDDLAQIKKNAREHFQAKGSKIPSNLAVEYLAGPPWGVRLTAGAGSTPRYSFKITAEQEDTGSDPTDRPGFMRLAQKANGLMTSDAFLDAISEAERNDEIRKKIEADPKGFLRGKGVELPDDIDVTIEEGSWCVCYCWGWWIFRVCACVCWW